MVKKFIRKDMHKKKRIAGSGWRKPKGITNKRRLNRKGHSANVRPGYGSPDNKRNTFEGLKIVTVYNVAELESIDPKLCAVVIASVGKQKKLDLVKKAEELKFKIVNLKVDKFKENVQNFFDLRKKVSKEKVEEKKKKEAELKELEKKADSKKKVEDKAEEKELSDEEKQKLEKKEKDKILTQKS